MNQRYVGIDSSISFLILGQASTCTGFAALLANNKYTKGYATTGVVAAIDARHGFLLPNGMGDLQKAERYVVMCTAFHTAHTSNF